MKIAPFVRALKGFAVVAALVGAIAAASPRAIAQTYAQFAGKYKLPMIQRGVLPDADGKLGGMVIDPKSKRMYIAATRAGSLEALDASGMKVVQRVNQLADPADVQYIADARMLAVSCGDGSVRLFKLDDEGKLTEDKKVELRGEADAMRYDADAKRLWVAHGYFVSWIDPATGKSGGEIKLNHAARGLAIDRTTSRLYASVGKTGEVVAIDRSQSKIEATWKLKDAAGLAGVDIDEVAGRLFVAAREPAALVVLDVKDGREVARVAIASDAGDTWYDSRGTRVYVSCGGSGGKVAMVLQESPDKYSLEHSENTAAGASRSLLLREQRRLVVTAPRLADQPTFVYTFLIPP